MNEQEAKWELSSYLALQVQDLFAAEKAYGLARIIEENSEQINSANVGAFLGDVQQMLYDFHTLALTKLYEPMKRNCKYPVSSIPTTLELLDGHKAVLSVVDRQAVEQAITDRDPDFVWSSDTDEALTGEFVNHFRQWMPKLPDAKVAATAISRNDATFDALRDRRDKRIAHKERVSVNKRFAEVSWEDSTPLISLATDCLRTIAAGYMGAGYGLYGDWTIYDATEYRTESLYRLLDMAGLFVVRVNEARQSIS